MDAETIKHIQNSIGYEFKNPRLLEQAFVRKSYSEEHPGILSNEVLEFYGDSALSIFVSKSLFDKYSAITEDNQFYSKKDEAALTEIKAYNINTETLSHCIRIFGFQNYLCLNSSDIKNEVYNSPHVQEDLFEAIVGAVAVDCNWDFECICNVCNRMLKLANLDKNYISWLVNWCNENGYKTPTFHLVDNRLMQFDSYIKHIDLNCYWEQEKKKNKLALTIKELGITVYSDSDTSFEAQMECSKKVYDIIQVQEMRNAVGNPNFDNSVNQLNMLAQKGFIAVPEYGFSEEHDDNGNPLWVASVSVGELEDIYSGKTSSKKEAKKEVAYKALCHILKPDRT